MIIAKIIILLFIIYSIVIHMMILARMIMEKMIIFMVNGENDAYDDNSEDVYNDHDNGEDFIMIMIMVKTQTCHYPESLRQPQESLRSLWGSLRGL